MQRRFDPEESSSGKSIAMQDPKKKIIIITHYTVAPCVNIIEHKPFHIATFNLYLKPLA